MKRQSNWSWYGVKIIKQIVVMGAPDAELMEEAKTYGLDFAEDCKQVFEESIMIVKAQSFDHAYKIAKKTTNIDNEKYLNIYGQEVEWKFIDAVDCFHLFDDILITGTEVYSCLHSADKNTTADEFINKWFSSSEYECRKARHL